MIRVLVVDDHPLVRTGLRTLLGSAGDMLVVAEAADGLEAVSLAAAHSPDVVLMDLSMPGLGGVQATRNLLAAWPAARVVVLTSFHDRAKVLEAVSAGAVGYLHKDSDPAEVLAAVRSAAAGHTPLDARVAGALLPEAGSGVGSDSGSGSGAHDGVVSGSPSSGIPSLSVREEQVLRLIMAGRSNKEIGAGLGIAERTVKVHVGHVFRRLGVADRTSAAMWARDHLG